MSINKIREYIMVKGKHNHATLDEVGAYNWGGDLKYTDETYEMLNSIFKMDSLITEVSYVIALDHNKEPKGICKIGQGNANETPTSMQNIFTFLLLTGANAFVLVHNHVSNMPEVSESDHIITIRANMLATLFNMEFIGHMIIHPCGYVIDGGIMDGTKRERDEYGDLIDSDFFDDESDGQDDYEPFANNADTSHINIEDMAEMARMLRERAERREF